MPRVRRSAPNRSSILATDTAAQPRSSWFGPPLGRREYWICAALFAAAIVVFGSVAGNDFIGLDDDPYLVSNPMVQRGLTVDGFVWAFTSVRLYYWHPLTWLSHMMICQLFGMNPAAHHLTNLLLHAINGVLLFLLLRRLTGAIYRSAVVAALFLVHPLRVESVAWLAERKDVLCALFSLLTILAYVRYTEDPKSLKRYTVCLLLFLGALMSKPMVISLPAILLILDFWPLGRWRQSPPGVRQLAIVWPLVREKLPMFVLAGAVGFTTVIGQREFIQSVAVRPLSIGDRLLNVPLTYLFYMWKTVWPHPLGLYYAYQPIPIWAGALCWAAIVGITWLALRLAARAPWFAAGWLWWIVALLPTIWITDRWDRFTYLPSIGLLLAAAWGAAEIFKSRKWPAGVAAGTAAGFLAVFAGLASVQTFLWRDRLTLYRHAVEVYDGNKLSQNNLGRLLLNQGHAAEAAVHLEKAVDLDPNYAVGLKNLGNAYVRLGKFDQARARLTESLRAKPDYADASFDLGMVDQQLGDSAEAVQAFDAALRLGLTPNVAARARMQLGAILWQAQRRDEALQQLLAAVSLDPGFVDARKSYASALREAGRVQQAAEQWSAVLSIAPGDQQARAALEQIQLQQ